MPRKNIFLSQKCILTINMSTYQKNKNKNFEEFELVNMHNISWDFIIIFIPNLNIN